MNSTLKYPPRPANYINHRPANYITPKILELKAEYLSMKYLCL